MNNDIEMFMGLPSDNLMNYPMIKLAIDIIQKYPVKSILPSYHWLLCVDGKAALDAYNVLFNNYVELSVIFGSGTYSANRDYNMLKQPDNQFVFLEKAVNAEIAILKHGQLTYIDDWKDKVCGWQSPDEIMQSIDKYIFGQHKIEISINPNN